MKKIPTPPSQIDNRASSDKYKYSIIWFAKSGCTLFRQLFLNLHRDELRGEPTNEWHDMWMDFVFSPDYKRVIVVSRNPYHRAVSMFTNKVCGGTGHNALKHILGKQPVTFKNFLLYLKKHSGSLHKMDPHLRRQTLLHLNIDDHQILKVKLENFNTDIMIAYEQLNLNHLAQKIKSHLSKPVFRNSTQRNTNQEFSGEDIFNTTETIFPEAKYFYNEELMSLVEDIYEEDFTTFSYDKGSL